LVNQVGGLAISKDGYWNVDDGTCYSVDLVSRDGSFRVGYGEGSVSEYLGVLQKLTKIFF
jgi:hypothetical protein